MNEMDKIIDFYDIYDYYYPPFWQTTWFWVTCVLVLLAVVGLTIFLIKRRRTPNISAWDWARGQLIKLNLAQCNSKDDYKKFYFGLTSIIKTYLHKRYGWKTEDKTDDEIISFLEQQKFDPEIIKMLSKVGEGALWIKFANMGALKSQAETDLQMIQSMIERTREQVK